MNAPDNAAGKAVKCPKCQAVVPVPAAEPFVAQVAEPPPVVAVAAPPAPQEVVPAERRRRDEDDEYDDRPRRGRGRFGCPFCGSDAPPRTREEMSQAGLVVMIVLILFCLPLFWIPLVAMKEQKRYCSDCGAKLGG
jgi:lipopolysaccharide-induced tumor necrosis factor-alpha factor